MLFDTINYVPFGSESIDKKSNKLVADVLRRKELSTVMKLNESQFIDFCTLVGNDYTKDWNRRRSFQFGNSRIPSNLAKGGFHFNRMEELAPL